MNVLKNESRIAFLDGLRGIAISLVVLYHAYAFWSKILPFGDRFAKFPIFEYGWLGVQLFYIISGFVIFMTLEKCINFQEFILRRWFRLFPAMLMCSIIVFVTAPFFPERPGGAIIPYLNLLPGLTFIEPSWWAKLLGVPISHIDGAFSTLYVEVKFYFVFGILYFMVGWRNAVKALVVIFSLSTIIGILRRVAPGLEIDTYWFSSMLGLLSADHFGWFAAGTLYYKYFREKRKTFLLSAIVIAMISAFRLGNFIWQVKLAAIFIPLLFTFALTDTRIQTFLTHPSLLFIGFISYPLYLVHQGLMVAMIIKMGRHIPSEYSILIPVLPIAIVIGIGWLVAYYIEPWTREQIRLPYKRICGLVGARRSVNAMSSELKS